VLFKLLVDDVFLVKSFIEFLDDDDMAFTDLLLPFASDKLLLLLLLFRLRLAFDLYVVGGNGG
jgi:hypothetical protein